MPIVYDASVSPADLTMFSREVPIPADKKLLNIFPVVTKDAIEVTFGDMAKVNRVAEHRAPDGRVAVAERDGWSDRTMRMLPLSISRNMGEYERLKLEQARTGGTRTSPLVQASYNDAEDLTRYTHNRMEYGLGDVLADGIFSPFEMPGVNVDYGIPASNKINAGVQWTNANLATLDALGDLRAASDVYESVTGRRPGRAIVSRTRMRAASQSAKLINAVRGAQTGVSQIAFSDAFGIFDSEGIPTIWDTYETQVQLPSGATRVLPDDKLILLPADAGEAMEYQLGVTATALELVNSAKVDFAYESAPGITVVTFKSDGVPLREFTYADAIGLPVVKDPKLIMILDVA